MTPYLFMFGVPGLVSQLGLRRPTITLLLIGLLYWVMIGFRFEVGADWNSYVEMYYATRSDSLLDVIFLQEPGFKILILFCNQVGGGLILVNAIAALIFCGGMFSVARRCREPALAVVVATPLLAIAFAMSATRQAIATGIIFLLYASWENRRAFGRAALVLLASLFHFSAIFILIFVALAANVSPFRRFSAAAAVALFVVLIILYAPQSMEAYSNLYVSGPRRLEAPGALAQVGVLAVAALVYLSLGRRWIQVNGDNPLYRNIAYASLLAVPATFISSVGSYRFALYFWPMAMYVWGGVPAVIESAKARVLYRFLVIAASAALLVGWLTLGNNAQAWLPYQNWFAEGSSVTRPRYMR